MRVHYLYGQDPVILPIHVHQDHAHQPGRNAEKVRAILPVDHLRLVEQAQVLFVNQPGRLQRLVGTATAQVGASEFVKFVVTSGVSRSSAEGSPRPHAASNRETDSDSSIDAFFHRFQDSDSRFVPRFRRSPVPGYNTRRKQGDSFMPNATPRLFAGLLLVLSTWNGKLAVAASSEPTHKVRVCLNSNNYPSAMILTRAQDFTSKILQSAGVAIEWHTIAPAVCEGRRR